MSALSKADAITTLTGLGFSAWTAEGMLRSARRMILGGPALGLTTTQDVAVRYQSGRYRVSVTEQEAGQ